MKTLDKLLERMYASPMRELMPLFFFGVWLAVTVTGISFLQGV